VHDRWRLHLLSGAAAAVVMMVLMLLLVLANLRYFGRESVSRNFDRSW
jgi:ABC-type sugar transport system permease subunit